MPATVTKYDAATQLADVQPGFKRVVRRADGSRVSEALPVVPSVPVAFLGGSDFVFAPPIKAGDTGVLLFAEYPIDKWRAQAEQGDPGDTRRHGLSGAIFLPGLQPTRSPFVDPDADHAVIGIPTGKELRIGSKTADEPMVLGNAYLTAEEQFFTDMVTNVVPPGSPSLATAGAQLNIAGGQPAWNPAVQAALQAAGAALTGINNYLTTFKAGTPNYKSDKIKGEK